MTLPNPFYFLATLIGLPVAFSISAQVILAHTGRWHEILIHILIYNPVGFWMSYGLFYYLMAIPFYVLYIVAVIFLGVWSIRYRILSAIVVSVIFAVLIAGLADHQLAISLSPILLLTLMIASLISPLPGKTRLNEAL